MVEHRKQAVSIRLGEGDVRNIKRMAQRLGVRDSDIIRYAVKSMLNRTAPLCDEAIQPIVAAIPLQLLAYHVAALRGYDIDRPRNLAKSVTVE